MNSRDTRVLENLRSLLEGRVALHSLFVFGSRARGNSGQDSDMDILVVVDDSTPDVERIVSECAWEVSLDHGVLIVPVVYSRDEWENGPERYSLLALAIEREGVPA